MWRNREVQIFIGIVTGLFILAVIVTAQISSLAAIVVAGIGFLILLVCILYSAWRYRALAKLAEDVKRINSGDYTLDLRDHKEGELSALKSDIAKMASNLTSKQAKTELDRQDLSKAIADISHQIKTPLTSLMMLTEFMADEALESEQRTSFFDSSMMQLERLHWLVQALLKLAKLDAGTVEFKKENVFVGEVLSSAMASLLVPIDALEIQIRQFGNKEIYLTCDFNWTVEAVTNVLKNAIEHSPKGAAIDISYEDNPLFTEISIKDFGAGIPKEELAYIFQRFYKGKESSESSVGIGLNLANSIVTLQNGSIDVKSSKGSGTTFTLKFYKQII